MERRAAILGAIAAVAASSVAAAPPGGNASMAASAFLGSCPPRAFATQDEFDLGDFLHRPWYVQQRMRGVSNTPSFSNLCVAMVYNMNAHRTFWGYDITLRTQSRDDRFPHASTFHEDLCARIEDRFSGKFRVGKCGRPSWFAKQYWVAAHDEKEGFAIVSGGAPSSPAPGGGCRTSTGLWIMTREQRRSDRVLTKARSRARELGFALSVLEDIYQEHCTDGAIPDDFHV